MVGRFLGFHHVDGVMDLRVERLSLGFDRLQAELLEGLVEAVINQLDPGRVFLVRAFDFHGALEIVKDRQQDAHGFHAGVFEQLHAFPLGALAEVLKFGLAAQQTVLQFGLFRGQLIALGGDRGEVILHAGLAGIGFHFIY